MKFRVIHHNRGFRSASGQIVDAGRLGPMDLSSLAVSFYHMLNVSVVSMFRLVAPSGTASLT